MQTCPQRAKFMVMIKEKETHEIYALEAIKAITRQRRKRYYLIIGLVIAVFAIGLVVWWIQNQEEQANKQGKLAKWPVAVILPNPNEGVVKDNAARQLEGFELAFEENDVTKKRHQHKFYFTFPLKVEQSENPSEGEDIDYCEQIDDKKATDSRHAINEKIKCWYDEGIRTFIITMSGAALKINNDFANWAQTLPPNDRPVLVATVASAPNIADRQSGVFRHYIRSRDESDVLATYIEAISATRAGIFHVKDDYGEHAKDLLKNRLAQKMGKDNIDVYGVGDEASIRIETSNFVGEVPDNERAVAVIIGYGDMIRNTLDSLKNSPTFTGDVLVVSTFTEEKWRPKHEPGDESFQRRIRYVGPHTSEVEDDSNLRGVVFQFSFLTLDRTLKCKDERGIDDFWNCFTTTTPTSTGQDWAEVEYTKDGDSHIALRLLEVKDDE